MVWDMPLVNWGHIPVLLTLSSSQIQNSTIQGAMKTFNSILAKTLPKRPVVQQSSVVITVAQLKQKFYTF